MKEISVGSSTGHSFVIALCKNCRINLYNLLSQEISEKKKTKQLQIITHYGSDHQVDILLEEAAELVQAICKWKRNEYSDTRIDSLMLLIEKMADVKNLIEQIELGNEFIKDEIVKNIEYKVDRQLKRIKRGE